MIHKRYMDGSKYVGFLTLFGTRVWSESLCVLFQLNFALAQLTDKRDPMYYTSKRPSESHNDGHQKKIRVAILDFRKNAAKIRLPTLL